jgi:hypothetical protein
MLGLSTESPCIMELDHWEHIFTLSSALAVELYI